MLRRSVAYTSTMSSSDTDDSRRWNLRRFDVQAFARAGQTLQGECPLSDFARLAEDCVKALDAQMVHWSLKGELREDEATGEASVWLAVSASTMVALRCQRCLESVVQPLSVEQWFRFVASEDQAELEDEEAEEDVLAWEPKPNILELIEDELLMALPMVPMHEACPVEVKSKAGEDELEDGVTDDEKPHPFASLVSLKKRH